MERLQTLTKLVCDITWTNTPHSIDENTAINTVIIPDTDVVATFSEGQASPPFAIDHIDPGPNGIFSIDQTSGAIRLSENDLDFETLGPIQTVHVQCLQTTGSNGVYAVTVVINNLNESPVFGNLPETISIPETTGTSTSIYRVITDDEDGDTPVITITSQTPATPAFTITNSDEVWTSATDVFDYDNGDTLFTITINIDDGVSTAVEEDLTVLLTDEIDETPSFGATSYTCVIDEGESIGTAITCTTPTVLPGDDVTDDDADDTLSFSLSGTNSNHFTCDGVTGVITTARILDVDGATPVTSYSLTMTVTDTAGDTATTAVVITVNDVNDNVPVFNPSVYVSVMTENDAPGTTVAGLSVTDIDSADATLTLTIESGDDATPKFAISGTDVVTSANALDYEDATTVLKDWVYTLMVSAEDGVGNRATATVLVELLSENEASPTFSSFPSSPVIISENDPIGFVVIASADIAATDTDEGADGDVVYSITSVTNGGATSFHIEPDTGEVTTKVQFDYESGTTTYDITITATDGGSPTPSSTASILTVNIGDYNDHAPAFDRNIYDAAIDETATVGSSVVTLTTSDVDTATTFSYTIMSGNDDDKFEFDGTTPELIKIKTVIDLDVGTLDPQEYELVIEVTDGGTPELTATATVLVSVNPINQHDPVFGATTPVSLSVSENDAPGTSVGTITASDDDFEIGDDTVLLTIEAGDTYNNFQLDSLSGLLEIKTQVDYEETGTPIVLTIKATDRGSPSRTATADFSVTVVNENDHQPSCTKYSYVAPLSETAIDNTNIVQLDCTDDDGDTLTYTIIAGNVDNNFDIDATGLITLATGHTVDYDSAVKSYALTVQVGDGTTNVEVLVTINVSPENDEDCYFDPTSWSLTVSENVNAGDVIADASVNAHDSDASPHGIVMYSIVSVTPIASASMFSINEDTGEITLIEALDRETDTTYTINVEVEDGSGATATADIQIDVGDINDNDPQCADSAYFVEVDEGTYPFTVVTAADLSCTDPDDGAFGTLSYSLESQFPAIEFSEDGNTGEVTLSADTLDFDASHRVYDLVLRVSDGDSPARTVDVPIVVTVNPIDDAGPTFAGPFSAAIEEGLPAGTSVELCTATDTDSADTSDGQITYSITSGDPDSHFFIDSQTGEVTTKVILDHEVDQTYTLEITATSNALTDVQTLTVTVNDVNDELPSCTVSTFDVGISEDTAPSVVYTLTCQDGDAADATLTFAITVGDTAMFGINSNGELSLQAPGFDYDLGTRVFDLEITVTDSASNDFLVEGVIYVLPVNEDPPVFVPSNTLSATVSENVLGSTVITISASDADSTEEGHGLVQYALDVSCSCPEFSINGVTGDVILSQALDYEDSSSHTIPLIASDSDNDVTATLTVTVTDENDNSPVFNPRTYSVNLADELAAAENVVTVTATDDDSSANDNNVIMYAITGGDVGSIFAIDPVTGEITTAQVVDYESEFAYVLEITAADLNGAVGALTDIAWVSIVVDPINEATPIFQSTPYAVNTPEDTIPGVVVITVEATDTDAPSHPHGQVRYTITAGNGDGHFSIDETTGEITTTTYLDRESIASYTLTVTATDSTVALADQLSATETVAITIDDVNDNTPQCTPSAVYGVSIPAGMSVTDVVITITTADPDDGVNGVVDIAKDSGDPDDDFSLSGNDIIVNNALDHDVKDFYQIYYIISDQGTPSLSSECSVSIEVQSVNDYAPVFSTSLDAVTVSEDVSLGTKIYTATATDDDTGLHGELQFIIISGNNDTKFMIDEDDGDVRVVGLLDREIVDAYQLEIIVFDKGDTPEDTFNDTMTLNIVIDDVNDNSPIFSKSLYTTSINENAAVSTSVEKVRALDADDGVNADVTYSIIAGSGMVLFTIQSSSGVINTDGDLDRETDSLYNLRVSAVDAGTPQRTSYAVVQITIDDENDNRPKFLPDNLIVFVPEDSADGYQVTTVLATDDDDGTNQDITYYLTNGDPSGQFNVDSNTAELLVSNVGLDREVEDSYILEIEGEDGGTPTLTGTATVTITITDVNDNTPMIVPPSYTKTISEDAVKGTSVFNVEATDDDLKENGRVEYTISSGNDLGHFAIDIDTGLVFVNDVLDRESLGTYNLVVTVSDNGSPALEATADVTIILSDINDESPVFTEITYPFDVVENSAAGTVVGTIEATDSDLGTNAELTYYIIGGELSDHFTIDADSGDIFASSSTINRESYDYYTLFCKVLDRGDPALFAETTVYVTVLDDNDNSPVFELEEYAIYLEENSPAGTSVITVKATDDDYGTNADVEYSIPSTETLAHEYFEIHPISGKITLTSAIDSEVYPIMEFSLYAEDTGLPTNRSGTALVKVYNTNVNDNKPVFSPQFYSGELSYSNFLGVTIVTVTATDADADQSITYQLVEESIFEVDRTDGEVRLSANEETTLGETYTVSIRAIDDGEPRLTSDVSAEVRIDTFDPFTQLVDFYLSMTQEVFLAIKDEFIDELNKLLREDYPTGRCGVSHVAIRNLNPGGSTRKLLADSDAVTAYVYALKNDVADYYNGVDESKDFVGNEYLVRKFAADEDGTPVYDLQSTPFDKWNIAKVTLHQDPYEAPWYMQWWGILIICLIIALFILLIVLIVVLICWRYKRREKQRISEKEMRRSERETEWYANEQMRGPKDDNIIMQPTQRDGWGSNEPSGRTYEYNTVTGERRWSDGTISRQSNDSDVSIPANVSA
ncbi:cadherin-23-like [Glandiceps talaboti]